MLESLCLLVEKEEKFEWQEQSFFIVELRSTMREDASTDEQGKLDGGSFARPLCQVDY